jgi:hypothetical protein
LVFTILTSSYQVSETIYLRDGSGRKELKWLNSVMNTVTCSAGLIIPKKKVRRHPTLLAVVLKYNDVLKKFTKPEQELFIT